MHTVKDIVDGFLEELCKHPEIAHKYNQATDTEWTALATEALVQCGKKLYPEATFAAKGSPDKWGQSEYFTLDVCGFKGENFGVPLFAAEHENRSRLDADYLQYAAWKTYCIDSERRILVSYFEEGSAVPSFKAMCDLVRKVAQEQRRKDLILIGAPWQAAPQSADDVRSLFDSSIIGVY